MYVLIFIRVTDYLDTTTAVTQFNKNKTTEVTHNIDPTRQTNSLSDLANTDLSTKMITTKLKAHNYRPRS